MKPAHLKIEALAAGYGAFLVLRDLGLLNTLWDLIIAPAATPTGVFLMRQYITGIPDHLIEAARIEGTPEWRILLRIIVPLAAVLQHRPPADRKGSVQGAASWLSWVGISAAALLQKELNTRLGWTPGDIFWFCGAAAVVGGIYVTMSRPQALPALIKRWTHG